ncbi:hypothetical protein ACC724_38495, partial [Rhizobium ruizarguesonis]
WFDKSVIPVKDQNGLTILAKDEHMLSGTDMQALASLNPSFQMPGEMGGFESVGIQAHPEIERINYVLLAAAARRTHVVVNEKLGHRLI